MFFSPKVILELKFLHFNRGEGLTKKADESRGSSLLSRNEAAGSTTGYLSINIGRLLFILIILLPFWRRVEQSYIMSEADKNPIVGKSGIFDGNSQRRVKFTYSLHLQGSPGSKVPSKEPQPTLTDVTVILIWADWALARRPLPPVLSVGDELHFAKVRSQR